MKNISIEFSDPDENGLNGIEITGLPLGVEHVKHTLIPELRQSLHRAGTKPFNVGGCCSRIQMLIALLVFVHSQLTVLDRAPELVDLCSLEDLLRVVKESALEIMPDAEHEFRILLSFLRSRRHAQQFPASNSL